MANRKIIKIGTILERPSSIGIVIKQSAMTTKILMIHKVKGLLTMTKSTQWLQDRDFVKVVPDLEIGRHKMIRAAFRIKTI